MTSADDHGAWACRSSMREGFAKPLCEGKYSEARSVHHAISGIMLSSLTVPKLPSTFMKSNCSMFSIEASRAPPSPVTDLAEVIGVILHGGPCCVEIAVEVIE